MRKFGSPDSPVNVIRFLHDGLEARVLDHGTFSEAFTVTNGVKQGCVLAHILFSILFAAMIRDAFDEMDTPVVYIQYRSDSGVIS